MAAATDSESRNDRRYGYFTSLPSVAALGVGVLYGAGALERATQLHGSHLRVLDFLAATPIQDLLALGVSVVVSAVVSVLAFTVFFGVIVWLSRTGPERVEIHVPLLRVAKRSSTAAVTSPWGVRWLGGFSRWLMLTPAGWFFLFLLYSINTDFLGAIAITVASVSALWWMTPAMNKQRRRAVSVFLASQIAIIGVGLFRSYVSPTPLPRVDLTLSSGKHVTGSLIGDLASDWYVGDVDGRAIVVPDRRVNAVSIAPRGRKHLRTGWQVVRSWFT